MIYENPLTGQVFAGCSSSKERDRWYFLDLDEYPKLFNERLLEALYDNGPLTIKKIEEKLGKELKDVIPHIVKAEQEYGSIETYKENGELKYRITKIGKDIVEMQKECETRWQTEKEFRRKLELE